MSDEIPSEEFLQEQERVLGIEMAKASRARAVFENEAFQDAVDKVKDACWGEFMASALDDHDARYQARVKLDVLNAILQDIRSVMETGQMAEITRRQIEERRHIRDAEPGEQSWQ